MYFFWVDCEMTGLDENQDHILEIACIITDINMCSLVDYHSVIHHKDEILNKMNDWCKSTHLNSGLWQKVQRSKKSYIEVENELMELLLSFAITKNTYIAGNSVYMDYFFIKKHMPRVVNFLHYRIFDISTFKILALKNNIQPFIKMNKHTAINDINESIAEFKYYEKQLFI